MNNDALSPVLAVMLILAVAVTIFSVYNAEYLPGLKQQAEVGHLQKVEESMARFGSSLENAISLKRELSMSEPVVLGGGDILMHSAKSSGTIYVQQEKEPVVIIKIIQIDDTSTVKELHFVNFSYWPLDNFWVDQGYTWQYGFLNVSRVSGGKLYDPVPLQYSTMDRVEKKKFETSTLGRSLVHLECTADTCNNITLTAVDMQSGTKNFTSGNGVASFELETNISEEKFVNVSTLSFSFGESPFRNLENWEPFRNRTLGSGNITLKMINITVSTS